MGGAVGEVDAATALSPVAAHRYLSLFALEPGAGEVAAPSCCEVADLFSGALFLGWVGASEHELPRVLGIFDSREPVRGCERVLVWVLDVRGGSVCVVVQVDFDAEAGELVEAVRDLRTTFGGGRKHGLRLGGRTLAEWAAVAIPGGEAALAPDHHHMLVADPGAVPFGRDGEPDAQLVDRLLSPRGEPYREAHRSAVAPPEPNRHAGMAVSVKPASSLLVGQSRDHVVAMMLSAVQALACLGRLRRIQREAAWELAELQEAVAAPPKHLAAHREALADAGRRIGALELELSFGVERFLNMRLLLPELSVQQFHAAYVSLLDLPAAVEATSTMLARLSAAAAEERAVVAARERVADERRLRLWSAVGGALGAVAVPVGLVFAFLGINTRDVDAEKSLFDVATYGLFYLGFLGAFMTAAGGAILYMNRIGGQGGG